MIILKSREDIQHLRDAGHIVAEVHALLLENIRPGVTTKELDQIAESWIRKSGATPSFLGYPPGSRVPFPATICASVNEELVHGIPGPRVLEEGDIITVDVGAFYKGFHGDAARTYPVGAISDEATRLLAVTRKALEISISQAIAGNRLGDISGSVQEYVESQGYEVTRQYTGHGIGREMHEPPQVLNYGKRGSGMRLRRGLTICIEPMVLIGTPHTRVLKDQWTVVSANNKLTAHFEDAIAITDGEPEILTRL
ncbi:MAG: type I methionyl aminopeptidase [Anaerolineae bacterium]|nr:type I methionyl aminopeptidase [Anaerolineae bacterium]